MSPNIRNCSRTGLALALLLSFAACSKDTDKKVSEQTGESGAGAPIALVDDGARLDAALAGPHRSPEERARDKYRNPGETLLFFGVEAHMTLVEIWPGGGWYANILAPYLASGGGTFYAAHFDPDRGERYATAVTAFTAKFAGDQDTYGDVRVSVLNKGSEIAPEGSADVVLTFRNVHNWQSNGSSTEHFNAFFKALKPGGVLGVVEHRADEQAPDDNGASGYVKESTVIALAEAAGFQFDQRSDINANSADTKDHPFGVWTLPPVRRSSAMRGETDPDFDRTKYDAIGESDRMTLKFRKPLADDGALME